LSHGATFFYGVSPIENTDCL